MSRASRIVAIDLINSISADPFKAATRLPIFVKPTRSCPVNSLASIDEIGNDFAADGRSDSADPFQGDGALGLNSQREGPIVADVLAVDPRLLDESFRFAFEPPVDGQDVIGDSIGFLLTRSIDDLGGLVGECVSRWIAPPGRSRREDRGDQVAKFHGTGFASVPSELHQLVEEPDVVEAIRGRVVPPDLPGGIVGRESRFDRPEQVAGVIAGDPPIGVLAKELPNPVRWD